MVSIPTTILSVLSILEKRMEKLPKNFLYPFCICVFSNFEKIFLKSTENFNKLYWNLINFIIINAKFSLKFSKFSPNIPKILFKIYFKFPVNSEFIENPLNIFLKFLQHSFPKIFLKFVGTNFSKNFFKKLIKISIKLYLRIAQILPIVYPKFSENFLFFCRLSTYFRYNLVASQHFHNQLIKVFCDCSSTFL